MTPVFTDVFSGVLTEVAVLLLLAAVIAAIGMRLRQSLIFALIALRVTFLGVLSSLGHNQVLSAAVKPED